MQTGLPFAQSHALVYKVFNDPIETFWRKLKRAAQPRGYTPQNNYQLRRTQTIRNPRFDFADPVQIDIIIQIRESNDGVHFVELVTSRGDVSGLDYEDEFNAIMDDLEGH